MAECARCFTECEDVVCPDCVGKMIPHEHGGYGFFPGGDPRCFSPDEESCSDEEKAAHAEACRRWDLAEALPPEPGSCSVESLPDGTRAIVTRARYGIGGYSYPCTDPNCEDSWPPDPREPSETKFADDETWDAAVGEAFAGDDEDTSDQTEMPW